MEKEKNIWWPILITGILFVLFGLWFIIAPITSVLTVLWFLGLFLLVDGVVEIISGLVNIFKHRAWGLKLVSGVLALIVGLLIFEHPAITAEVALMLAGFVFLIHGISDLFLLSDAKYYYSRTLSVISGILGILVAFLLFCAPLFTGVVLIWIIGLYTLIVGAISIGLAFSIN